MESELHITGIGAILIVIGCLLGAVVFIVREAVPFSIRLLIWVHHLIWVNSGLSYWLWHKWNNHEFYKSHTQDFWDLKFRILERIKERRTFRSRLQYYIYLLVLRDLKKYHGREL